MHVLVIGGTVFVGRHVVEEALRRGHEVTLFHRGRHGGDLFPGLERVLGDRTQGMRELQGRSFDAVIDTCLFDPGHVPELDAGFYVFVSTAGVYRDWPHRAGDESMPTYESGEDYSALKAATERRLEEVYPGRSHWARAGVIVGPHENIRRLPTWLWRMQRGGRVLAPRPPEAPIQLIDARDLAAFLLHAAENRLDGPYNVVAPPGYASWGELLELCRAAANPAAELVWADARVVASRVEQTWEELPLWPSPGIPGLYMVRSEKAIAAGLQIRGLGDTVRDTWEWLASGGEPDSWREEFAASGIDPALEAAVIDEAA